MAIKDKIFNTDHLTEIQTPIFEGVKDIKVELVSCILNPYKNIVEMALTTWGSKINKWECLSPEERFQVVLKVLQRKALPLGLESPVFLFSVYGVTRSSFDQIARTRIGATFSSLGWNNIHTQTGFRIPNEILDNNPIWVSQISNLLDTIKTMYSTMISCGISWQSAREILPMGLLHWFYFSINYLALQGFCSRRLCFSEKEDTVATAWLMRQRIKEQFPLLSTFLRPSCDWSRKCSYHSEDSIPEEMGSLFKSCNRNVCDMKDPNIDFDLPSTDMYKLEEQLEIFIPKNNEELPPKLYNEVSELDKMLFEQ